LPPGNCRLPLPEELKMLAFLLAGLAATSFQSTVALDMVVAQFTGKALGEAGGAVAPVDARLKLAPCPAPQLSWRTEARDTVVVTCLGPSWRLFVPVKAAPRASSPGAIAAAPARPLPVIRRGDPVMVEAGADGFSITRDGVAMGDAPAGGRLLVKVDERKPPIQAVALEAGRAKLPGWAE
jgi:flagella basal body P-ring formation protein FlgA